jgi:hypothetical protein
MGRKSCQVSAKLLALFAGEIFGHFPAKFGAIFRPNVWSFVGQFFGHSIGQIFGHFYSKCSAIFLLNVMNGRRLCWLLSHRGWTE